MILKRFKKFMLPFCRIENFMKKSLLLILCIQFCPISSYTAQTPKIALIFGVNGQDGVYLTDFLLEKGYHVHGVTRSLRRSRSERVVKIARNVQLFAEQFVLHEGDVTNAERVRNLINTVLPDEIYNLAAQSNVADSFEYPEYTAHTNALGALHILESIKNSVKKIKFFNASSSEIFGKAYRGIQNEKTPFDPCSPYAIAKIYAHYITKNYRDAYQIFACNGILFNHESPLRPINFVTRKITHAVAQIKQGNQEILYLGNLNVKRDWGYAQDYVEAMWLTLQQSEPHDYVIATGKVHSIKELIEIAFKYVGIEIIWQGSGLDEQGIEKNSGKVRVAINPEYFRPLDVDITVGDPSFAYEKMGWFAKTDFERLIRMMVDFDLEP